MYCCGSRIPSFSYGIDYSEESVAVARETNRGAIERGQVDIQLGDVAQLPFADGTFDVVTAIETHYYWPDLPRDVRHLMQVLKPVGVLLVVAETYRGRRNDWLIRPIMQGMFRAAYLSPAEHKQLLVDAVYRDVEVFLWQITLNNALQPTWEDAPTIGRIVGISDKCPIFCSSVPFLVVDPALSIYHSVGHESECLGSSGCREKAVTATRSDLQVGLELMSRSRFHFASAGIAATAWCYSVLRASTGSTDTTRRAGT